MNQAYRPHSGTMEPPVASPAPSPAPPGPVRVDPALHGNSFVQDQMRGSRPAAAPDSEAKRGLSWATALPKTNNLSRLVKAGQAMDARYTAVNPIVDAYTKADLAGRGSALMEQGPGLLAMEEAKGAGVLKAGTRLGGFARAMGMVGGGFNIGSGAWDIAHDKDENGEKYLQVLEGGLGMYGAAAGNPYAASASTGMMLGRSSNSYYEKHTGKSLSEWIGDAGAAVASTTSSGLKGAIEDTALDGSASRWAADGAGWALGGATVLGGSVLGAAASVGGGLVGMLDGLIGD